MIDPKDIEVDSELIIYLLDAFVFLPRHEQQRIVAEVRELRDKYDETESPRVDLQAAG